MTLEEFLEATAEFEGADAEHAALTEALNCCYDLLDDGARARIQAVLPAVLKECRNMKY